MTSINEVLRYFKLTDLLSDCEVSIISPTSPKFKDHILFFFRVQIQKAANKPVLHLPSTVCSSDVNIELLSVQGEHAHLLMGLKD